MWTGESPAAQLHDKIFTAATVLLPSDLSRTASVLQILWTWFCHYLSNLWSQPRPFGVVSSEINLVVFYMLQPPVPFGLFWQRQKPNAHTLLTALHHQVIQIFSLCGLLRLGESRCLEQCFQQVFWPWSRGGKGMTFLHNPAQAGCLAEIRWLSFLFQWK